MVRWERHALGRNNVRAVSRRRFDCVRDYCLHAIPSWRLSFQVNLLESRAKRLTDARIVQGASDTVGQADAAGQPAVLDTELDVDLAAWVDQRAGDFLQWPKQRCNRHLTETEGGRADAQERGEAVEERVRAPAVAVGAGGLGLLGGGRESLPREIEPELHALEQRIGPAEEAVGLEQVVAEVDRCAGQPRIAEQPVGNRLAPCIVDHAAEQGEALRMLGEVPMAEIVGEQAPLLVPELPSHLRGEPVTLAREVAGELRLADPLLQL